MLINIGTILLVLVLIAVVYWAVDALGTPEPLNKIVKVGSVCIAIIIVVFVMLQMLGMAPAGSVIPKV